jgi:hypothetical protein
MNNESRSLSESKVLSKLKVVTKSRTLLKSKSKVYEEKEAKFYAKYAKFATCASSPILEKCKECSDPGDTFKLFYFYQMKRFDKYNYNFLIHYSDVKKQVVISFSGPLLNDENNSYVKLIYNRDFTTLNLYKIKIENEFYQIYFNKIRPLLVDKINKIIRSGRKSYKFIFTGHSIGGSLSILSAYDLVTRHIISKYKNKVTVYTFAALRIGDQSFVKNVNLNLILFRITKSNDLTIRAPNCYYTPAIKIWRCFPIRLIEKYINKDNFPLKLYFMKYLEKSSMDIPKYLKKAGEKLEKIKNSIIKLGMNMKNYKKYIFYSQPIGQQILYNEDMTSYNKCSYKNNIPNCEEKLKIPASFSIMNNFNYFNFKFDKC